MTASRPKVRVVNLPKTTTIIALIVMAACVYHGGKIDWNTAMAMVLTFYFTKEQAKAHAA